MCRDSHRTRRVSTVRVDTASPVYDRSPPATSGPRRLCLPRGVSPRGRIGRLEVRGVPLLVSLVGCPDDPPLYSLKVRTQTQEDRSWDSPVLRTVKVKCLFPLLRPPYSIGTGSGVPILHYPDPECGVEHSRTSRELVHRWVTLPLLLRRE